MSRITRLHPVIRVRGEMATTPEIKELVNSCLKKPMPADEPVRLFTEAQSLIDPLDFRAHPYNEMANDAAYVISTLGQRAIELAEPFRVTTAGGSIKLLFGVCRADDGEYLWNVAEEVRALPTLELSATQNSGLVIELARRSLKPVLRKRPAEGEPPRQMDAGSATLVAGRMQLVYQQVCWPLDKLTHLPYDLES